MTQLLGLLSTLSLVTAFSLALGAPTLAEPQAAPTDAQIIGIVLTANDIDISYGASALRVTRNKGVREFANQMVSEHSTVQQAVRKLAGKLKIAKADSDTAAGLRANARTVSAKLRSLKGAAFDRFYIDNEVAYHELVVGALAKILIPSVKDPQLKAALEGALPLFEGHLAHAKQVQASFASKGHM